MLQGNEHTNTVSDSFTCLGCCSRTVVVCEAAALEANTATDVSMK